MNLTIITAAVAAAMGFGAAWQIQGHFLLKQELEHKDERIEIQRAARAVADRASTAVIVAQNHAATRGAVLRRELDAVRGTASGLREQIDLTQRTAATSLDACTVAANATSELLVVCAERYTELAGKAEGHVSDIRTLTEAWPK